MDDGYVKTCAAAMTIMTRIFKTMGEIQEVENNSKSIIIGTMVASQAIIEMLTDMCTSEPMPRAEFITFVSIIRKEFETYINHKL